MGRKLLRKLARGVTTGQRVGRVPAQAAQFQIDMYMCMYKRDEDGQLRKFVEFGGVVLKASLTPLKTLDIKLVSPGAHEWLIDQGVDTDVVRGRLERKKRCASSMSTISHVQHATSIDAFHERTQVHKSGKTFGHFLGWFCRFGKERPQCGK